MFKADKAELFENELVKELTNDCALHVAAFTPSYLNISTVDETYIRSRPRTLTVQAAKLDKPAKVLEGIVKGKLSKHLAEICFLQHPFVKATSMSVEKKVAEVGKSAGGSSRSSTSPSFEPASPPAVTNCNRSIPTAHPVSVVLLEISMQQVLDTCESKMLKSLESLSKDFSGLRPVELRLPFWTKIRVDYYGSETPINQVATVSVPEARMIVIQPWDKSVLSAMRRYPEERPGSPTEQ
jgi:hypothetical protein